jgi:hypothetical protein
MITQYGAFSGIMHACLKHAGHPEAAETVVRYTGLDVQSICGPIEAAWYVL